MTEFRGFPGYGAPRFTMIPDVLLDEHLSNLGHAELKVLLVVMRKTYGWRKERDSISLSQLQRASGLTRRSVSAATASLEQRGYILIERELAAAGDAAANVYRLRFEAEPSAESANQDGQG